MFCVIVCLAAASSAPTPASPTFISQYGPLLAALVALCGVLITLTVSGWRDGVRYRSQREDEYRKDQRDAIAAVAVAGHKFRKECVAVVGSDNLIRHNFDPDLESARLSLLNELTVARLLIQDPVIRAGLDGVYQAWKALSDALDMKKEAFTNRALRGSADDLLEKAFDKFDSETAILYTAAMGILMPTVADTGGRISKLIKWQESRSPQ
jgi:hypothetical protein